MSTKSGKRPSFEDVHYLLRPAKNVQRKMICEALARLEFLRPLAEYRYIGFGAIYFGDFSLFHRRLGIEKMTTIEGNLSAEDRVKFNKPFDCIEVEMGLSTSVLPVLKLESQPNIIWFDYDGVLKDYVRIDIRALAASAAPCSVIIVTLDARWKALVETVDSVEAPNPEEYKALSLAERITQLTGDNRFLKADLVGDNLSEAYRQSMQAEMENGISERNRELTESGSTNPVHCKQLFNFRYQDQAEMMTVGWLIYSENDTPRVNAAAFDNMDFHRDGKDYFRIKAPKLTFHEVRVLNRHLPCANPASIPVPVSDEYKADYTKIYRYFPSFAEADI
jgi:hypothetical protein